jgi:AcrR family transcriptional regulator
MPQNVDKRILKTKHAIRCAFRELIQKKEMSEISICELTKAANITRSTFYMYYAEVGDVRDEIENEIINKMHIIIEEEGINRCLKNPYPVLSSLSKEIMKFDEYNRYLVNGKNSNQLIGKIKAHIVEMLISYLEKKNGIDIAMTRYIATFIVSGILDTYKEWFNVKDGISLEELCRYSSNIIINGQEIIRLAGLDLPTNYLGEAHKTK